MHNFKESIKELSKDLKFIEKELLNIYEFRCDTEFKSKMICDILEDYGFSIQKSFMQIKNAARAFYSSNKEGPVIAFISSNSYNNFHNTTALVNVWAGIIAKTLVSNFGGTILIYNLPKTNDLNWDDLLLESGDLNKVDVVLMANPISNQDITNYENSSHFSKNSALQNMLTIAADTLNFNFYNDDDNYFINYDFSKISNQIPTLCEYFLSEEILDLTNNECNYTSLQIEKAAEVLLMVCYELISNPQFLLEIKECQKNSIL